MADPVGSNQTIASLLPDLLKHPDDLSKLSTLKSDFTRKKSHLDTQLSSLLAQQNETTQSGMTSLQTSQKTLQSIKEEMQRIDKLCRESAKMIEGFPEIGKLSVMQKNFAAVEGMVSSVMDFRQKLGECETLLRSDEGDLENQPNLLVVHEALSALREARDSAMEQVKGGASAADGGEGEGGLELIENLPLECAAGSTLRDLFGKLEEVVEWFDEHVGTACVNLIPLVQNGNNSLVVRLALVIEEEEKKDKQVKALRDAHREFGDIVSRFQGLNASQRELRGYKAKFLQAISASASAQFESVKEGFLSDPDKLEKSFRWFFNDLNTVKLGLIGLVPKKWKIFETYTNIYHNLMRSFLLERLDVKEVTPAHMLAILNWIGKYYNKMNRLGVPETELRPHVIDERESDLVREYRGLITRAVEQWMDRMGKTDKKAFHAREENGLDQDSEGRLHTKTLGDLWTMLREQISVAQSSGRPDVVEGVVDSMIRALKGRQQMWERLVDEEVKKIESTNDPAQLEGVSSFQEWLAAIANDQITNIDDNPETNSTSFLTRFNHDWEPYVTPAYISTSAPEFEILTNGYVDLATHCMHLFAQTMFITDFKEITKEFFTQKWYQGQTMKQITTTFEDYLSGENNYTEVLHPSLRDILIEELSDALLIAYLSSVRNKSVKFRRQDPFSQQIKSDLQTVFSYFSQFPDTFELVKEKWRAVLSFETLLSAEKGEGGAGVVAAFEELKRGYWDVQIGWVEAVVRSRDDSERGVVNAVKGASARLVVERGGETVLGKVK